jgi:hypothetical protein
MKGWACRSQKRQTQQAQREEHFGEKRGRREKVGRDDHPATAGRAIKQRCKGSNVVEQWGEGGERDERKPRGRTAGHHARLFMVEDDLMVGRYFREQEI